MPKLQFSVPHQLGRDSALERLKTRFAEMKTQFGEQASEIDERWTDHHLDFGVKAFGMEVTGQLAVAEQAVHIDARLPLAASFFSGTIEERMQRELRTILASPT